MRAGGEIKCPAGTVYIPKGQFEGQEIGEMCVDQGEFTVEMGQALKAQHPELDIPQSPPGYDRPRQPLVDVSGYQAAKICEARGMRLLTPSEWAYAASGPNRFEYSTRTGKLTRPGINFCYDHECPREFRDVGAGTGDYVQWGGQELFDMCGNSWEWTYDPIRNAYFISGGASYVYNAPDGVKTTNRVEFPPSDDIGTGFRCAVSPQNLFAGSSPLQNFLTARFGESSLPDKTSPL